MTLIDLGIKLRKGRTSTKKTQKQLGKMLGVGESTVRMWELGKNKPSPEVLKKISKILDIPLYELMSTAGYMDNRTLIDVMISEVGATAIEMNVIKGLIADYEGKAKRAKENDKNKGDLTTEENLFNRDKLRKHLNGLQNRQAQLINKIYNVAESESLLFEVLTETKENDLYNEESSKHIKDIYLDFFQLNQNKYELFYKGEAITQEQVNDIMKFIETFIIKREGD